MSDREFWIAIRAALLLLVNAIDRKWQLGKYAPAKTEVLKCDDVTALTGV